MRSHWPFDAPCWLKRFPLASVRFQISVWLSLLEKRAKEKPQSQKLLAHLVTWLRSKMSNFYVATLSILSQLSVNFAGGFRYLSNGLATTKSDVYAFGVVLFEIISGKEATIRTEGTATKSTERRSLVSIVSSHGKFPGTYPILIYSLFNLRLYYILE